MKLNLRRFPWLVAMGSLLLFLLTLSFGVTPGSLGLTVKVAGWDWQPIVGTPLVWLFTWPLRLLPAGWIPTALNLFTAVCASATLGILTRSLELMPWFRPLDSLAGWKRRLPALLAVAVCGLEFNFWQNATAATGEMLDVLVFAVAIWCALEFRAGKDPRWFRAAVLVWGLGMAENWMMILTLPFFVIALVWLRPQSFLRWRFVLSLAGWGMAGFSVYALLPVANSLAPNSPWSLGESWIHSLKQTRQIVAGIYFQFWQARRMVGLAILIFYLLPTLACLMRLPDEETDNKSGLDRFQIWTFRGLRAGLLAVCLWLAFDPVIGPQGILKHQMNVALPLLSFDYLNGLAAGFLAGSLLLVQRKKTTPSRRQRFGVQLTAWLERAAFPLVLVLLALAGIGLATRNGPALLRANHDPLTRFGELALRSLPADGGIILSDFPEKLAVFQAAQARRATAHDWLAVDVQALPAPEYRERLEKLRPGLWQLSTNRHKLAPIEMLRLVGDLAHSNRVFYLHPSFGYFFEAFYAEPAGSVYELKLFQTNFINPPPLTAERFAQNEKFWDQCAPKLDSIQGSRGMKRIPIVQRLESKLHLDAVPTGSIPQGREWVAMGLNGWGVELQRAGRLPEAQRRFAQALALDTNNWIARGNLYCNTNLQAGNKMSLTGVGNLAGQLGSVQNFSLFLARFGPVDEPQFCYLLGDVFAKSGLLRQAMQQLERAAALAPEVLAPRLALTSLYTRCGLPDRAMESIGQLRREIKTRPGDAKLETGLSLLEADVCLSQTNLAGARAIYQAILRQNPGDPLVESGILQAYAAIGDFTNAEQVVTGILERQPDSLAALLAKSGVLIQTGRAAEAIPVLDHILSVTNSLPAKVNRAIAYLQTTNYAGARKEYLELLDLLPNPFFANLGLGEVALRQGDTNGTVQYFTQCLSNAPANSGQWRTVRARLDALAATAAKPDVSAAK